MKESGINNLIAETVVAQLNKLLGADRNLVESMVDNRIPVSTGYMELDEFVYMEDGQEGHPPAAGLIGVLNGLLQLGDDNRIAAQYSDEDMKLIGFTLVDVKSK